MLGPALVLSAFIFAALAGGVLADAVSMAERALAFAEDKPTGFLRAWCLDEAWSRIDPRAAERAQRTIHLEKGVLTRAEA